MDLHHSEDSKNPSCGEGYLGSINPYEETETTGDYCQHFEVSWAEPPVKICEEHTTDIDLPVLVWHGYNVVPKILSVCNTGQTITVNGQWACGRPYIEGGPLNGKYIFSQIHFHCPSEHEIDGRRYPLEMHVVHYKTNYLTQERAMHEKDGMLVLVYLFRVVESEETVLSNITKVSNCLKTKNARVEICKIPLSCLVKPFVCNYYVYCGSVTMKNNSYELQWIVNCCPSQVTKCEVEMLLSVMSTCSTMTGKGPKMKPLNNIIYRVGEDCSLSVPSETASPETAIQMEIDLGVQQGNECQPADTQPVCPQTLPCAQHQQHPPCSTYATNSAEARSTHSQQCLQTQNVCGTCGGLLAEVPKHHCKCRVKVCSSCGGSKSRGFWCKRKWSQCKSKRTKCKKSTSYSSTDTSHKKCKGKLKHRRKKCPSKHSSDSSCSRKSVVKICDTKFVKENPVVEEPLPKECFSPPGEESEPFCDFEPPTVPCDSWEEKSPPSCCCSRCSMSCSSMSDVSTSKRKTRECRKRSESPKRQTEKEKDAKKCKSDDKTTEKDKKKESKERKKKEEDKCAEKKETRKESKERKKKKEDKCPEKRETRKESKERKKKKEDKCPEKRETRKESKERKKKEEGKCPEKRETRKESKERQKKEDKASKKSDRESRERTKNKNDTRPKKTESRKESKEGQKKNSSSTEKKERSRSREKSKSSERECTKTKKKGNSNEVTTLFVKMPETVFPSKVVSSASFSDQCLDEKNDTENDVPKEQCVVNVKTSEERKYLKPKELWFHMRHFFQPDKPKGDASATYVTQGYEVSIVSDSKVVQEYKGNFQPHDISSGSFKKLHLVPKYQDSKDVKINLQECLIKKQSLNKFSIDSKFLLKGWYGKRVFPSVKEKSHENVNDRLSNSVDAETQYGAEKIEKITNPSDLKCQTIQTEESYFSFTNKIKNFFFKKMDVKSQNVQTEAGSVGQMSGRSEILKTTSEPVCSIPFSYLPEPKYQTLEDESSKGVEKPDCDIKFIENLNEPTVSASFQGTSTKPMGKKNIVYFMYDKIEKDPKTGKKIFRGRFRTTEDLITLSQNVNPKTKTEAEGKRSFGTQFASEKTLTKEKGATGIKKSTSFHQKKRVTPKPQGRLHEDTEPHRFETKCLDLTQFKVHHSNATVARVVKWFREDGASLKVLEDTLGVKRPDQPGAKASASCYSTKDKLPRENSAPVQRPECKDETTMWSSHSLVPENRTDIESLVKLANRDSGSVVVVPVEVESLSKMEVLLIDHSDDKKTIKDSKKYIPLA